MQVLVPLIGSHRCLVGLGLHFVPGHVRFTTEARKSKLWRSYIPGDEIELNEMELPEEDFPLVWKAQ
jgi:hypothetical protein